MKGAHWKQRDIGSCQRFFTSSPPNGFNRGQVRIRLDSRLKHAGMMDFGSAASRNKPRGKNHT
jgi:hypothetical protein